MLLTVQEQFENLFDADTMELYMDIGQYLLDLNYTLLGSNITEIIQSSQSDEGKRIDIHAKHVETLLYTLSIYGIRINKSEAYSLTSLFNIVKFIGRIEDNENHDDILSVVDAGDDDIESLIALAQYLKDVDELILLRYVESVHPLFFERLEQHHSGKPSGEYGTQTQYQDRTRQWLAREEVSSTLGELTQLFFDSRFYGFNFDTVVLLQEHRLLGLPDRPLAYLLKALALASDLPDDEVFNKCARWCSLYLEDPQRIMNVTSYL